MRIKIKIALLFIILLMCGCGSTKDVSTIPQLYFEGNLEGMQDKSDIRNIEVTYKSTTNPFSGYAEIKLQGTSSLSYDKKNYTVKFYEDENLENKLNVDLGWGEQNKYCLKANWIDKTHARNVVTAKLVSQIQEKYHILEEAPCNGAIDGFPIEIYVNDEFHGIYTFNIPKDAWMFGMDSDNPNHIVICGDGWKPTNIFRGEPNFSDWEVEVGEENEQTLNKMKRLFDFVMNSSDEDFKNNFENYLDKDASLNYFIMTEFAFLRDNRGKNMLLATYDGQKWFPSLYDLDTSWGTDFSGLETWEYNIDDVDIASNYLFERIETCFGNELANRYFELREEILTKEHIMQEFESFEKKIPEESFNKELERWGQNIPGFGLSQIEEYLDAVMSDLDHRYELLKN